MLGHTSEATTCGIDADLFEDDHTHGVT